MKNKFIYSPRIANEFKCRVPLKETEQIFIVNGKTQNTGEQFSLNLKEGEIMCGMKQLISVRTPDELLPSFRKASILPESAEELSFSEKFVFGNNSSGNIILCSHTFSLDSFKTKENISIELGKGASAQFVIMQNEHNNSIHESALNIKMEESSSLKMVFISLHGGKISNKIAVDMNGKHALCDLSGICLTDTSQIMETEINLNHNEPLCISRQLFKGILDDKGVSKFYGKIKVAPDSQKTEAYQANHNLLISDNAKAYTKPQLEIYADDVKCSHGATVGRLNENELFYMRTRGIPLKQARLLQQMAFAYEVLEKITEDQLRERMQSLVERRLKGEFSKCKNCSKNCC